MIFDVTAVAGDPGSYSSKFVKDSVGCYTVVVNSLEELLALINEIDGEIIIGHKFLLERDKLNRVTKKLVRPYLRIYDDYE